MAKARGPKKIIIIIMQSALNIVHDWCEEDYLKVNPIKTILVPFRNARSLRRLTKPTQNFILYQIISNSLESNHGHFFQYTIDKVTTSMFICHRLV